MNETYVTLRGWLGADVRHRLAGDTPVAEFRLGVTPRWFDSKRSEWVDAPTQWYTVKAWRHLADNCRDSLRRADPVVVHGRLSQSTWFKDGVERTSLEVTAVSSATTCHWAPASSAGPCPSARSAWRRGRIA